MAVLTDVNYTKYNDLGALQEAARARGIEYSIHRVASGEEIAAAIDSAQASGAKALNILSSPLFYAHRHLIMDRQRVPTYRRGSRRHPHHPRRHLCLIPALRPMNIGRALKRSARRLLLKIIWRVFPVAALRGSLVRGSWRSSKPRRRAASPTQVPVRAQAAYGISVARPSISKGPAIARYEDSTTAKALSPAAFYSPDEEVATATRGPLILFPRSADRFLTT
jgi:hypothetical protein